MKKTDQIEYRPNPSKDGITVVNERKTHRNDPCPCGATELIVVNDGETEIEKPKKFKHCCLEH